MARCEQGYLCEVCGKEVEEISDSDLYLRYVLGEVPPERLHLEPDRHLSCNPCMAQYIVSEQFTQVPCPGPFDKHFLDRDFVSQEETRITRGWERLMQVAGSGIPISEYPLDEVKEKWVRDQDI